MVKFHCQYIVFQSEVKFNEKNDFNIVMVDFVF